MKNTGAPSEQQFEDMMLAKYGKKVFVYRIEDAKAARGLNKRAVITNPRPSDYIVTAAGDMFYAEIKSTIAADGAVIKLRPGQKSAIMRQQVAGGNYFIFIHSLVHHRWYRVPGWLILKTQKWSWNELESYHYD